MTPAVFVPLEELGRKCVALLLYESHCTFQAHFRFRLLLLRRCMQYGVRPPPQQALQMPEFVVKRWGGRCNLVGGTRFVELAVQTVQGRPCIKPARWRPHCNL